MSVCFSILETDGCLILRVAAISACALPAALRSSRRLSTSSLISRYRASMRSRRCFGSASIISPTVRPIRSSSPQGGPFQPFQMRGKASVGHCDQLLIETGLARPRLVARDQQNTVSARIESKGHSPDSACCIESNFLHVRMLRPLQGIHIRSSELRSVFGQNPRDRQQFVLNRLLKGQKLLFEVIRKTNGPRHLNIALNLYSLWPIVRQVLILKTPRGQWRGASKRPRGSAGRSAASSAAR